MDDEIFVKLQCRDCELEPHKCELYPFALVPVGEEGCTRKVTEDEAAKFLHYMKEVLPFIPSYKTEESKKNMYKEIDNYLQYIYSKPLGVKINKKGKAVTPKIR